MTIQWGRIRSCWLEMMCLVWLPCAAVNVAPGGEVSLVVPTSLATTEGGGSGSWPALIHAQYIYDANEFDSMPNGGGYLTGLRFRPDGGTLFPANWSVSDLSIAAAVTSQAPSTMSLRFTDNYLPGSLAAVRATAPWQGGTQNLGPAGGPKAFDIDFALDVPYRYDPAAGNLLLEFVAQGLQGTPSRMDRLPDGERSQAAIIVAWDDWFGSSVAPSYGYVGGMALELTFIPAMCDFDADGDCDVDDLNAMLLQGPLASGVAVTPGLNDRFDLTGDGVLDNADVDQWLGDAALIQGFQSPYLRGDANLSGAVDGSDFNLWNSAKFTSSLLWDRGDFNGDGLVDGGDFGIWNNHKFTASMGSVAIPEPSPWAIFVLGMIFAHAGRSVRRA